MCKLRRMSYTQCARALTTGDVAAILFGAILFVGNIPAFSSSSVLETINCTQDMGFPYGAELTINCLYSTADGATQLEAIERTLADTRNTSLQTLTIRNSLISRWPSEICRLPSLREIRFNESRISELPNDCFGRLPDLEVLWVERNRLTFLQDGLFDGLKKLRELSFDRNNITSIGLRVFSNISDLLTLQKIDLGNNGLTDVEPWPFIRAEAVEGVDVYLAGNRISHFTNELGWSFFCGKLGKKSLVIKLDLGNNQIKHLTDITNPLNLTLTRDLLCLFGTKAHSPFDITFGRNPINCDCNDYKVMTILRKYQYIRFLDDLYCHQPIHLVHQKLVTVMSDMENFVCDITDLCPIQGKCTLVPANRTLVVSLSNAGLRSLPPQLPPLKTERYKYQLDFSRNSIAVLSSQAYLANDTYSLDVSQSGVETVTDEAWTDFSGIKIIHLHFNRLTTLSPVVQSVNYTFQTLSLYGNPLSCDCRNPWVKHWLKEHQGRLGGPDNILCLSPSWLTGRAVFSVEDPEHCTDPDTARRAAIGTSTAVGVVIVLGLVLFTVVHRLRVHLFSAFRFHPFDRDECEGEDMEYDVFLTCSHEDRSHAFKVIAT